MRSLLRSPRFGIVSTFLASALVLVVAACGPAATGGSRGDSGMTADGGPTVDGQLSGDGGDVDGSMSMLCPTGCTLGAKSCDGAGVRTCEVSGMCTDWSAPVACGGATPVCSGGLCVATCSSQCTLGASYCSSGGVRTCIAAASGCNDWSTSVTPCGTGNVCSGGGCVAACSDRCATGAKQCTGVGVQSCERKATGCLDWSDPVPCTGGNVCSMGMCQATCSNACAAGDKRCVGGDQVQSCDVQASGCRDWSPAQLCPGGQTCSGNMCMPCVDGTMRCAAGGAAVERCMTGTFTQVQSCPFGCGGGMCSTMVTCTPGAYRCNGLATEVCNSSGTAYLTTSTCAVSCTAGLCTGACTPGAKRCNAATVETCNGAGTAWTVTDTCASGCDGATSQCALATLTIAANTDMNGVVVVNGPVIVRSGATLSSPSGDLTIRATSITVELGGTIAVAPVGMTPEGSGTGTPAGSGYGGYGGGYGTQGGSPMYASGSSPGPAFGSALDSVVAQGGQGGLGYNSTPGGKGGGVIRLLADTIMIAGTVTANGAPGNTAQGSSGGGSGGGILIAAPELTISGSVSATGGLGGGGSYMGGTGGLGRVKLLGATRNITGTVNGQRTDGLLPPLQITSSTHPDQSLIYNDDFPAVALTWSRAFPSRQGYYFLANTSPNTVPTPANGTFAASELASIDRSRLVNGANYFHVSSVDATSAVGTVETPFRIRVNTTAPTITSSSHASQTTWSANRDVFYAWTLPVADANVRGVYYILDRYGDTVPTTATGTFLPVAQKQLLRSALDTGIWGFHVVSIDTRGYLTKAAAHYQVRLGTDPGNGAVLGRVVGPGAANVSGATVRLNRGLFPDRTTIADGSYNFGTIPLGTWEITVSKAGFVTQTKTVTITTGAPNGTVDFTLAAAP